MSNSEDKLVAVALGRLERLRKAAAFDPVNMHSIPTDAQQEVINDFGTIRTQWIVAATQSGKSQTCSRIISWVAAENHPKWKRPDSWGSEPLLILVAGRTGKQIDESLYPKLISYLEPGTYKAVRVGNIIQRLELDNGNRIVFQSLENAALARERIQSYVAHAVWVDEMPPTAFIIDELLRRVQARSGYFMASFTPLVVNNDIRRMVDSAKEPYSKKYKFTMLDNPLYKDPAKKIEILESMSTLSESTRNTRLYGDWSANDEAVYYFDQEKMVEMPEGYSPMWRHVESVDPALKSALGLTIWAENPATAKWYCVMAEYVKGIFVPTELVTHVKKMTSRFNIVRRISDPHEVWYIQTAASMGINYIGVFKKNERKSELIKNLQEKLSNTVLITPGCSSLITELETCRWSDRAEGKIVNASSFHLLDSAQYFCDNIPKPELNAIRASSVEEQIYKEHWGRKTREEAGKKKAEKAKEQKIRIQQRRSQGAGRWNQKQ